VVVNYTASFYGNVFEYSTPDNILGYINTTVLDNLVHATILGIQLDPDYINSAISETIATQGIVTG